MTNIKFWELTNIERQINLGPEESLLNVYRVLLVKEYDIDNKISDPYQLMEALRKINAPIIKCDVKLFFDMYMILSNFTIRMVVEYVFDILSKGRGLVGPTVQKFLFDVLFKNINSVKTILVTDCEKYGVELFDFITSNKNTTFYLSVKDNVLQDLFKYIYKDLNVNFVSAEIYTDMFTDKKFDLIVSVPMMGGRVLEEKGDFISREPSFIAAQNLLYHLSTDGKLIIVLPAKIGFGGGDAEVLRRYIIENYKVNDISSLPSKVFYPYMAINTYLLSISQGKTDAVNMSKYILNKVNGVDALEIEDNRLLFSDELAEMNNWNVDMAFSLNDETILNYKTSTVKKSKIKEVADVFRGKAISSKSDVGNVAVVNISDISETGIDYSNLDVIEDEERKVARYLLQEGDVLVSTKGFAVKVAVYETQPRLVIPSSNLCVIRPNTKLVNGTYLKLFLESEIGMKLIKSLQRGTTIVNINYQDICELEVPVPPMEDQLDIANEYKAGLELYKKTIAAAEEAWSMIKKSVSVKLF